MKPLVEKPVLILAGPTASGKSDLALELAEALRAVGRPAEILCCDSITVYRRLEVGSAKPSAEDRRRFPHHLLDLVEPLEAFTAGDFVRHAAPLIERLHAEEKVPVLAGGAGFYLRALLKGMASSDEEDQAKAQLVREQLEARAEAEGYAALYAELRERDPGSLVTVHANDHYRILRALQAMELYGRPWSELNRAARAASPRYPGLRYFALRIGREELLSRVEDRTRRMLRAGLLEEVKSLLSSGIPVDAKPLLSVGYKECVDVLEGRLPAGELEGKIVQETMRLAKRQMTWFRGEEGVEWLEPEILRLRAALMLG